MLLFLLLTNIGLSAQQKLFHTYTASVKLVKDVNELATTFFTKVKLADASMTKVPQAILNTQPYLVFYTSENNSVNLPLWFQLNADLQLFFSQLSGGNKSEGKKIFGLFFNGFYIARELGHAVQFAKEKNNTNKYQGELFANTLAILFWRESANKKELEKCYNYVNSMLKILPDPVPAGENEEDYFNKNYQKLAHEPGKYGYIQFSQFKRIYEDKSLPGFIVYLKNYSLR